MCGKKKERWLVVEENITILVSRSENRKPNREKKEASVVHDLNQ
jgi:hypothetical protein